MEAVVFAPLSSVWYSGKHGRYA